MGRTNKLVDGCYSFWQGAISALLGAAGLPAAGSAAASPAPHLDPAAWQAAAQAAQQRAEVQLAA